MNAPLSHPPKTEVPDGVTPFMATRIRPRTDSHSTTHSTGTLEGGPNRSQKAGVAAGPGGCGAAVIRFFNRV